MACIAIIGNQGFSMLNFRGALIAKLVAQGHEIYALAPDMPLAVQEKLAQLGAKPIEIALARTGINPLADLKSVIALRRRLVIIRPDIVLAYAAKPVIYGTIAAWLSGVRHRFAMVEGLGYVFIQRPSDGTAQLILRSAVKRLYRFALSKADRVLFLNDDDIADFTSMGLVHRSKAIRLGGIGVDLHTWRQSQTAVQSITFTMVARLLRDKGVIEFIEAARLVRRDNPGVRFCLVGGLDNNPEAIGRAEVEAWVEEGLVEWPGHVAVRPYLESASVFVLPSYREGVPRSTQEAMATGRAVITTDVPGCRDTIIDGINGFLVPPRDTQALAEAMQRFIDNPALIGDMGQQSRCLAEERFDERKVNARIIDILGL